MWSTSSWPPGPRSGSSTASRAHGHDRPRLPRPRGRPDGGRRRRPRGGGGRRDGVDAVCHQAAKVGLGVDFGDVGAYVADNDAGTASLLEALWRRSFRGRLVLASSMVVYGEGRYRCDEHGDVRPGPRTAADLAAGRFDPPCPVAGCGRPTRWAPVDEDAPARPPQRLRRHQAPPGAPVRAVGPGGGGHRGRPPLPQRLRAPDAAGHPVRRAWRRSSAAPSPPGRAPEVFEDGGQTRDFVHVRDVARANVLALTRPDVEPGAYNVASGTPHTVGELAAGPRPPPSPPSLTPVVTGRWRLGDVRHVVASPGPGRAPPSASGPRSASRRAWPSSPVSPTRPPLTAAPGAPADGGRPSAAVGFVVAGVAGVALSADIATGGDILAARWAILVRLAVWSVVWAVGGGLRPPPAPPGGAGRHLRWSPSPSAWPPWPARRCSPTTSTATPGTGGCRPPASTRTATRPRARAGVAAGALAVARRRRLRRARPAAGVHPHQPADGADDLPAAGPGLVRRRLPGRPASTPTTRRGRWRAWWATWPWSPSCPSPCGPGGGTERWTALYALSPFPVLEVVNNGHVDGLAALFVVAALLAAARRRPAWAGALIGAATLVKLYPALLAGGPGRRGRRWRGRRRRARPGRGRAAAAGVVVVAGYLPHVLAVGVKVLGYLPGYLREEHYDSGGRYLLASLLHLPVVARGGGGRGRAGRGDRLGGAGPARRPRACAALARRPAAGHHAGAALVRGHPAGGGHGGRRARRGRWWPPPATRTSSP